MSQVRANQIIGGHVGSFAVIPKHRLEQDIPDLLHGHLSGSLLPAALAPLHTGNELMKVHRQTEHVHLTSLAGLLLLNVVQFKKKSGQLRRGKLS